MQENRPETRSAIASEDSLAETQQAASTFNEDAGLSGKQNQHQPVESVAQPTKPTGRIISARKLAANRRNSQRSTGPKTVVGKAISSWNSLRHGLLSRRLIEFDDQRKEQFFELLASLQQDLDPVGALEQVLVEKIAHEYWRLATAADYKNQNFVGGSPFSAHFDQLVRYETMINRQLFQAINQLERLQRLRRGEEVPAPVNLQVSHDGANLSEEENSRQ